MKNKVKKGVLELGAKMLTKIAYSTSASACSITYYQSKEPICLREK